MTARSNKTSMNFKTMSQLDVPRGRNGKHKQVVTKILSDLDQLPAGSALKVPLAELAEYLYRELSFPHGSFLLTGTGIVPPDGFTLASGDRIEISIEGIGTLVNEVA